jgi:hypothetical protein
MFYIKLEGKTPIGHPVIDDNLKNILEVSVLTDALLKEQGYVPYENSVNREEFVHVTSTTEYFLDVDGVVRNKLDVTPYTQEELLDALIRKPRSYMLATSDWTQSPDSPLSPEKKQEWTDYRAELRALTTEYPTAQKPEDIVWPVVPE